MIERHLTRMAFAMAVVTAATFAAETKVPDNPVLRYIFKIPDKVDFEAQSDNGPGPHPGPGAAQVKFAVNGSEFLGWRIDNKGHRMASCYSEGKLWSLMDPNGLYPDAKHLGDNIDQATWNVGWYSALIRTDYIPRLGIKWESDWAWNGRVLRPIPTERFSDVEGTYAEPSFGTDGTLLSVKLVGSTSTVNNPPQFWSVFNYRYSAGADVPAGFPCGWAEVFYADGKPWATNKVKITHMSFTPDASKTKPARVMDMSRARIKWNAPLSEN